MECQSAGTRRELRWWWVYFRWGCSICHDHNKSWWLFCCYSSSLWPRPPHDYRGQGMETGYTTTQDTLFVLWWVHQREIPFVLNGVNLGVSKESHMKSLAPPLFWRRLHWTHNLSSNLSILVFDWSLFIHSHCLFISFLFEILVCVNKLFLLPCS